MFHSTSERSVCVLSTGLQWNSEKFLLSKVVAQRKNRSLFYSQRDTLGYTCMNRREARLIYKDTGPLKRDLGNTSESVALLLIWTYSITYMNLTDNKHGDNQKGSE